MPTSKTTIKQNLIEALQESIDVLDCNCSCEGCEGTCTYSKAVAALAAFKDKDIAFVLTYDQGKAVQEILKRYLGEELQSEQAALQFIGEDTWQTLKDISHIEGLASLFDDQEVQA
jgi:hypothetical protein